MFTASLIFCQKMLTSRKVLKSFTIFQFVHQYISSGVFVSWAACDTALDHACLRLMDRLATRCLLRIPTGESQTRTEEGAAWTGRAHPQAHAAWAPGDPRVRAGGGPDALVTTLRTDPDRALGKGQGTVQLLRGPSSGNHVQSCCDTWPVQELRMRGQPGMVRMDEAMGSCVTSLWGWGEPLPAVGSPPYATWLCGVPAPPQMLLPCPSHTPPPSRPRACSS